MMTENFDKIAPLVCLDFERNPIEISLDSYNKLAFLLLQS
jgi:hypothetical protein